MRVASFAALMAGAAGGATATGAATGPGPHRNGPRPTGRWARRSAVTCSVTAEPRPFSA